MNARVFIHLTRLEFVSLLRTNCINKVFGGYYGNPIESLVQRVEQNCRPKKNDDCPSARLVMNGTKAEAGQWPFMAAIKFQGLFEEEIFLCGGNLLTSRHVLSG